jgi:hypothetical protein
MSISDDKTDRVFLFSPNINDVRSKTYVDIFMRNVTRGSYIPIDSNNDLEARNYMTVKNYLKKPINSKDSDIHPEFTNFIISVGKYMRELDPSSEQGTYFDSLRTAVTNIDIQNMTNSEQIYDILIKDTNIKTILQHLQNVSKNTNFIQEILTEAIKTGSPQSQINQIKEIFIASVKKIANKNFEIKHHTIANNNYQKLFAEKVFGIWDTLSIETQQFYLNFIDLLVQTPQGSWEVVRDYQKVSDISNHQYLRINLKKGDGLPLFIMTIPEVPIDSDTIYTSETKQLKITDKRELLRLFSDAYFGKLGNYQDTSDKQMEFNIDKSKFMRELIWSMKDDFGDMNSWKIDTRGLYKTKDSKKIYIGQRDNNCYTTQVKGTPESCDKYLLECLLDGDKNLDKCKVFMAPESDFFNVAQDEIHHIHPMLALRTLEKFGFIPITKFDSVAKMNLKKMSNIKDNNNNLMSLIKSNPKLSTYLDIIVDYVNANPALLNEHYDGQSEESKPKSSNTNTSKSNSVFIDSKILEEMRNYIEQNVFNKNMPQFILVKNNIRFESNSKQGGGIAPQLRADYYTKNNKRGAVLLENFTKATITELSQNYNVTIDEDDIDRILHELEDLKNLEDNLIRKLRYIEKYYYLVENYRDFSKPLINMETLTKLVDQYSSIKLKYTKAELGLLKVVQCIHKLKEGNTNDFELCLKT